MTASLAMDETPTKAGKSKKKRGRMHQGYYWPTIYGDQDEVVFTYSESRARRLVSLQRSTGMPQPSPAC